MWEEREAARLRRETHARSPPGGGGPRGPPRPIAIGVGIALIALGLPTFIIVYRASVSCTDLQVVAPSCVPFPIIPLLVLGSGIVLVIASFIFRKAQAVP